MIRLTRETGDSIFLASEMVCSVLPLQEGNLSLVSTQEDGYKVTESPEEVVRKIMEYKLAMVRYGAASNVAVAHADPIAVSDYAEGEMNRLAGLEESLDA